MNGSAVTEGEAVAEMAPEETALPFEAIYRQHFSFVWRTLRRLGVPDAQLDDACQEVFLVFHRRQSDFEGRSSIKTWLFRILTKVAANQRRSIRRKSPLARFFGGTVAVEDLPAAPKDLPDAGVHAREADDLLCRLLAELSDDRRAVFVLSELEEMTVPQIAELLALNLNTAYARLRSARKDFEKAVKREQARERWRTR